MSPSPLRCTYTASLAAAEIAAAASAVAAVFAISGAGRGVPAVSAELSCSSP